MRKLFVTGTWVTIIGLYFWALVNMIAFKPSSPIKTRSPIEKELASITNHPWAGHYRNVSHSTTTTELFLAPRNGYVFKEQGCFGGWAESGRVIEADGTLKLKGPPDAKFKEIILVPWGE